MADANPPRPSPPPLDDACALFLDVDGTLVEFSDDPAAGRVLPQVLEAIGAISDRLGGAVALVSGRPLAQLDALFAPLRLPAAGLHGHQFRSDAQAAADLPDEWVGKPTKTASVDMKKAIRNIQAILNNNGFNAGTPDGEMGKKTVTAIKAFQKSVGQKETGEIDDALVTELLKRNKQPG